MCDITYEKIYHPEIKTVTISLISLMMLLVQIYLNIILVNFDIANILPTLKRSLIRLRSTIIPPVKCILEGLELAVTLFLLIGISCGPMLQYENHICPAYTALF